jgi:hypothetical protein
MQEKVHHSFEKVKRSGSIPATRLGDNKRNDDNRINFNCPSTATIKELY